MALPKKLQKAFELYHGTEKIYLDYVKTICLSIDTFINIKFDKNLIFEVQWITQQIYLYIFRKNRLNF